MSMNRLYLVFIKKKKKKLYFVKGYKQLPNTIDRDGARTPISNYLIPIDRDGARTPS